MPSRAELKWSQVKVGLVVAIAIAILLVIIFLMTGKAAFAGKLHIATYVNDAAGLQRGALVNLAGVSIGSVTSVRLAPNPPDPLKPVRVDMAVARDAKAWLRQDSVAELGAVNPLGGAMVNIHRGTLNSPAAVDGTVLRSATATGISQLLITSHTLLQNANDIIERLGALMDQIQSGQGSIGKLLYSEELYDRFNVIAKNVERLTAAINARQGTVGELVYDRAFYAKLNTTLDRLNDTLNRIQHGPGTVAKLINDPSLYNHTDQLVQGLKRTTAQINSGHGAIGVLLRDRQTALHLRDTVKNLDGLLAGLQAGRGTAGQLVTNPALYHHMDSLTTQMRALIKAFRKHPKKYLTIQLKLF
ncbi:MAG: MlaD family protein [Terriglobales bacterium]